MLFCFRLTEDGENGDGRKKEEDGHADKEGEAQVVVVVILVLGRVDYGVGGHWVVVVVEVARRDGLGGLVGDGGGGGLLEASTFELGF